MGWKNLKSHYRIGHIVQVTSDGVCIGSPYVHNLVVVARDGRILKRVDSRMNEDLMRYQTEIEADSAKVVELLSAPDTFERDLTVFTFEGGVIVELKCEEYGWPNVTHDGRVMYENRFSPDRQKVIEWAKRDAAAGIEASRDRIASLEEDLKKANERRTESEADLARVLAETAGVDLDQALMDAFSQLGVAGYELTEGERERVRAKALAHIAARQTGPALAGSTGAD